MKKHLSFILACTFILLLPVQAQARVLKPQYKLPKTSEKNRASAEDGVKIGSKTVRFKEFTLVDSGISAMLPENAKINPQYKDNEYEPYPGFTLVSVNDELFFSFNAINNFNPVDDTPRSLMQKYGQSVGATVVGRIRSEKLGAEITWADFYGEWLKNPLVFSETKKNPKVLVYVLCAAFEDDGAMYRVEFYCPMEYFDKYEKVIQATLATLKAA